MPIKNYTQGSLNLEEIAAEFGGVRPHSLNEYYAGGGLVPSFTVGYPGPNGTPTYIPSGPTTSINNFYGSIKKQTFQKFFSGDYMDTLTIPPGTWYIYAWLNGAGGGGGGGDAGGNGGNGGAGHKIRAKFVVYNPTTWTLGCVTGGGGQPGYTQVRGNYDSGRFQGGFGGRVGFLSSPEGGTKDYYLYGFYGPSFTLTNNASWNSGLRVNHWIWNDTSATCRITGYEFDGGYCSMYHYNTGIDYAINKGYVGDYVFNFDFYQLRGWQSWGAYVSGFTGGNFRITNLATGKILFDTIGAASGGTGSGAWDFLNGGNGGEAGNSGTSGGGGGGGAATMMCFWPDTNTTGNFPILLGIAAGGGGGSGAGYRRRTNTGDNWVSANWQDRGFTANFNTIYNGPPNETWGGLIPVPVYNVGTAFGGGYYLKGQGYRNYAYGYYPPGGEGWTGGMDGGGGGGGGGPWGRGGGVPSVLTTGAIDNGKGNPPTYFDLWAPYDDWSGAAGSRGYMYYNPTYTVSWESGGWYGGNGGSGSYGASTPGSNGLAAVRVTNIDDGFWPAAFTIGEAIPIYPPGAWFY